MLSSLTPACRKVLNWKIDRRRTTAAVILLIILVGRASAQNPPSRAQPPNLSTPRYDEDYLYLRYPQNRTGAWWEPLKYIPLDSRGWAYLTLGDETRLRYENYTNNEFGSATRPDEGYFRFRDVPYADLHLGSDFRLFGQLITAYGDRSDITKNPFTDETGVDVLQAFAEWRMQIDEASNLMLRGGRQVISSGSSRLINAGPNIRLSFDGGRIRWENRDWRLDGFLVRPVKSSLESFDNSSDPARLVWALYTTYNLPQIGPQSGIDLIYIGFENDQARFNQGDGEEKRHTVGARFFGNRGSLSWDWEAHWQFGSFDAGNIAAWSFGTDTRYTFRDLSLNPYLQLKTTLLSGDRDPDDRDLQTFNAMFAQGGYFGESGVIGPSNLMNVDLMTGIELGGGWSLSGGVLFFWRQSLGDGLYGVGGNLIRPDGGSRSRYIGTQGDIVLDWQANRNLSFNFAYSILEPGAYIEDTGPAQTVQFFGAQVVFRF